MPAAAAAWFFFFFFCTSFLLVLLVITITYIYVHSHPIHSFIHGLTTHCCHFVAPPKQLRMVRCDGGGDTAGHSAGNSAVNWNSQL